MTTDDKLKKIYQKIFLDAMIYGENYPMQMIASTYLAIAMRIYKTILDPKEFSIVEVIDMALPNLSTIDI